MRRHPWLRLAAWLVDCLCILAWIGVTAAVGIPLYRAGVLVPLGQLVLNATATLLTVVPAVVAMSWLEAGRRGATIGKRALGLRVSGPAGRVTMARALVRNVLKIGVPWIVGHAAVFEIVRSSAHDAVPPPGVWLLLALAYVLPILYVASLFIRSGRTPYDRVAKTSVAIAVPETVRTG